MTQIQIQHYTCLHQWLHPSGQHEEKSLRTALRYVYPQEMEALLFHNGFHISSLLLRQLAARPSHSYFSLDDLSLPETCLALPIFIKQISRRSL